MSLWWESSSESQRENHDYVLQRAHDSVLHVFSEPLSGINKWDLKWAWAHMIEHVLFLHLFRFTLFYWHHSVVSFVTFTFNKQGGYTKCFLWRRHSQTSHKCVRWKNHYCFQSVNKTLHFLGKWAKYNCWLRETTFCGVYFFNYRSRLYVLLLWIFEWS